MLTNLKIERQKRNIKSKDLARKAGVDPSYISLVENGRAPSNKVKRLIAKALNLPIKTIWKTEV